MYKKNEWQQLPSLLGYFSDRMGRRLDELNKKSRKDEVKSVNLVLKRLGSGDIDKLYDAVLNPKPANDTDATRQIDNRLNMYVTLSNFYSRTNPNVTPALEHSETMVTYYLTLLRLVNLPNNLAFDKFFSIYRNYVYLHLKQIEDFIVRINNLPLLSLVEGVLGKCKEKYSITPERENPLVKSRRELINCDLKTSYNRINSAKTKLSYL